MISRRKRLGEILLKSGLLTTEQLEEAVQKLKGGNGRLGQVLVDLGYLTESDIYAAVGEQLGVPFVSLSYYSVDPDMIKLIPEQVARQNKIIPLFRVRDSLTLGMSDPLNLEVIDQVVRTTGLEVEPAICSEREIDQAIDHYYGTDSDMEAVIDVLGGDDALEEDESLDATALTQMAGDAPIVRLVNLMISQAVKEKASDIHVEPEQTHLRIRFRVDGILREVYSQPKKLQNVIISRLKIMANLDIAERRLPQDGRIQIRVDKIPIDIRVSTIPTVFGENVVMRILDKSNLTLKLSDLGFGDQGHLLKKIIQKPHGIVLVTGPTGSGKTTTLYSILRELSNVSVNTVTLEDPVEYKLSLIRQSQVNVKTGMSFAAGLRSLLRQDPDIIMVGEIRDRETAQIAVEAALTGHTVLSTLHTNDAPGALPRLIDMGVEPFLLGSSISGVIAQRLVRQICTGCKFKYNPSESQLKLIGMDEEVVNLFKGKGCRACGDSGYKGRIGIFEVLMMDEKIRSVTTLEASPDKIRRVALNSGMRTLRQSGIQKALDGQTTLDEVVRVTATAE